MFAWFALAVVFVLLVWLLGHTYYLLTQMKDPPADENDQSGKKEEGEIDDEHR